MKQLPLFNYIVFVDWHGVLSQDPFWTSILHNEKHPLRLELNKKLGTLFSQDAITHEWMRGSISSDSIVADMNVRLDGRFSKDFLMRRLMFDCERMHINVRLLHELKKFRPGIMVVIATDNVDCFARTFEQKRLRKRRRSEKMDILSDWADYYDAMICSSEIGILKAEDPKGFFGPLLSGYGLEFSNALLIDDRADNCQAFRQQGGRAVQWKLGTSDIAEVTENIINWIKSP